MTTRQTLMQGPEAPSEKDIATLWIEYLQSLEHNMPEHRSREIRNPEPRLMPLPRTNEPSEFPLPAEAHTQERDLINPLLLNAKTLSGPAISKIVKDSSSGVAAAGVTQLDNDCLPPINRSAPA